MTLTWEQVDHLQPRSEWRLPIPPTCRRCAYNLTGLEASRCPECGATFRWQEVRRRAARTWSLTRRLKHANQDATVGLVFGLSGWVALLIARVSGSLLINTFGTVAALGLAVLTIVLGSQVLNLRRVPKWARQYVGDPPPSMLLGTAAILTGLALFAGVFLVPGR